MECPDCANALREIEVTHEFPFGSTNPSTLKATAPVLVCDACKLELHGWQMEQAKSLAIGKYLRENKPLFYVPEHLDLAHAATSNHRKQLEHVGHCGCFYCLKTFEVKDIGKWIDEEQTALCPKCGIDSVIPMDENVRPEFLKEMQQFWFDQTIKLHA